MPESSLHSSPPCHYFVDEAGDGVLFAVVRHKQTIVEKVLEHNKTHPRYRYHPNQLYDRCVSRLFRDRLHKEASYVIQFSRRGNRTRTGAANRHRAGPE